MNTQIVTDFQKEVNIRDAQIDVLRSGMKEVVEAPTYTDRVVIYMDVLQKFIKIGKEQSK